MQNSLGYEDAFKDCWTGPADQRFLPEFDDFVKKYRLTLPDGTFDKLARE